MAKQKVPTWQQQAAGVFSWGGRNAPFRDMVPNTRPMPEQQLRMSLGFPRDRLAEAAYAGTVRGINNPGGPPLPPMRSPTVENPATPDEIRRAFGGTVTFAPGATAAQTEAAQRRLGIGSDPQATLDFLRRRQGMPREVLGNTTMEDRTNQGAMVNAFRTGDFSGTDATQFARPSELDAISRLIQSTRNQNPPRPNITPPASQPGEPGFGESYYAGRSNVIVPGSGRRASNQALGAGRVGAGIQSTGMTGGGVFGSGLMMSGAALPGMIMGGLPDRQQPELVSRPMRYGSEITPSEFAEAWKNRKMTTSDPQKQADAAAKRQEALAARQAAVEASGKSRGQAREERMQFARDAQYFGPRGALIRAFSRQGVDPERAMAMMQGNMQFLSEDNRQRRAADEFAGRTAIEQERNAIERDRLDAEIAQATRQENAPIIAQGQAAFDAAIAQGQSYDQAALAGQAASNGLWKPQGRQMSRPSSPQTSGTPQRIIDEARAAGLNDLADKMERENQELEYRAWNSQIHWLPNGRKPPQKPAWLK